MQCFDFILTLVLKSVERTDFGDLTSLPDIVYCPSQGRLLCRYSYYKSDSAEVFHMEGGRL